MFLGLGDWAFRDGQRDFGSMFGVSWVILFRGSLLEDSWSTSL